MDDPGEDATGQPWKSATTGDVIHGHVYRLRRGTSSPTAGERWSLDMRGEGDWSKKSTLGSHAGVQWEPTRSELAAELAGWMPDDHSTRLLDAFVSSFPDLLC